LKPAGQKLISFKVKLTIPWREVTLEWVLRLEGEKGFKLLPKRWIVERTFGWLSKQRRLSKDYQGLCETSEAMVYAAMIRLMVARLDY